MPGYDPAPGCGCTEQTLTWSPSSDLGFPQADQFCEVLVNCVDSGNDILGNQISGGMLPKFLYLPLGTDANTIVAVNPDGLICAPGNSFTGTFTADC